MAAGAKQTRHPSRGASISGIQDLRVGFAALSADLPRGLILFNEGVSGSINGRLATPGNERKNKPRYKLQFTSSD